ncbi:prefoldin subunit 5 [Thalassospira sp. MBR-102]|uniref:SbcC/MukB-like Walker B domain-containing protein n=1 Tax=Thalassospira sp. MBR-102 TaxID=3156466 RepID=UPI003395819C
MMNLTDILCINWHLFDREHITLSNNTAILGGNRTGKSTIMDAIQIVMAGGKTELFDLNRASTQSGKTKRTIADYCRGRLSETFWKRDESRTYIALVFRDAHTQRAPISIGLQYDVSPESEKWVRPIARFVIPGVALSCDDFLEFDAAGDSNMASVLDWMAFEDRIKVKTEALTVAPMFFGSTSRAEDYISEYLHHLTPAGQRIEPRRLLKTLVRGLAFERMASADAFVRHFLLEPNPIDIAAVRTSIQTYYKAKDVSETLAKKLERLKAIEQRIHEHRDVLEQLDIEKYVVARARFLITGIEVREIRADIRKWVQTTEELTAELERIEERKVSLEAEKEEIESLIRAEGIEQKRDQQKYRQKNLDFQRQLTRNQITTKRATLLPIKHLITQEHRQEFHGFDQALSLLVALNDEMTRCTQPDWPVNAGRIDHLLRTATTELSTALDSFKVRYDEVCGELSTASKLLASLEQDVRSTKGGSVPVSPNVAALINKLEASGMKPKRLCELVEVVEEEWRDASEAMLGPDREALFVAPEQVRDAIEILRRDRRAFSRCRIARTDKLQKMSTSTTPGTLANALASSEPQAVAFVIFRLGSILQANQLSDLGKPGRAIMRDGTYDDGIAVTSRSVNDRRLGAGAAALHLQFLTSKVETARAAANEAHEDKSRYETFCKILSDVIEAAKGEETLENLVGKMDSFDERIAEIDQKLAMLSSEMDRDLQERKSTCITNLTEIDADRDAAKKRVTECATLIKGAQTTLNGAVSHDESGKIASRKKTYGALKSELAIAFKGRAALRAEYETNTKKPGTIRSGLRKIAEQSQETHDNIWKQSQELAGQIHNEMRSYFLGFGETNQFLHGDLVQTAIAPWVKSTISFIESDHLIEYQEETREAAEQATRMFREHFLSELRERVDILDTEIKEINLNLTAHCLTNEHYSLHKILKDDFRDILVLAQADHEDLRLDELPLFGAAVPDDHPHRDALAKVEGLLQNPAYDFSDFEDYRNYFVFELKMVDQHTKRETSYSFRSGTGSGGEIMAPFYITIGASLASLYHGGRINPSQPQSGFGLALFDEAFANLDAANLQAIMQLFQNIGLQVLTATPREKRAQMEEVVDATVLVGRYGNESHTTTNVIKERTRQAMREINPANLSDADLKKRLDDKQSAAQ